MKHICTYFDRNFLPRGLQLIQSLKSNCEEFTLYLLAIDEETYSYFKDVDESFIELISIEDFDKFNNSKNSKFNSQKELYFSITPGLCLYLMENYSYIDMLLYLDADVCLFNNLEIVYEEIGTSSIAMCSHRIPWFVKPFSRNYGKYNVGVNFFRRDRSGMKCLKEWHASCLNWHKDIPDYTLPFFSDQIWLDAWPEEYDNLKIISHKGINTAPWNAINYSFSKVGNDYFVDEQPLVIYHFACLKKLSDNYWSGNANNLLINIKGTLLDLYIEYINSIDKSSSAEQAKLKFEGSKLKLLIYKISQLFFNDRITVN